MDVGVSRDARHPRPSAIDDARSTTIALTLFLVAIAIHATGAVGDLTYPVVVLGGMACTILGLRRHRPSVRFPWILLLATAVLWTAAGVVRQATDATGDMSSSRSLLPDLFAFPGYLVFGVALYALLRSRAATGERGATLDGIMLAAGASLIVHELLIAPTLGDDDAWVMARVAVAVYPAVSMCLLVLAARLAFGPGERSVAFALVLAGTVSLLIGDIVFAYGEIGVFQVPQAVLEIPYLLVPAFIGSAVLHPSITQVTTRSRRPTARLGPGRLFLVSAALLAPLVVIATHTDERGRMVAVALSGVLAATAIVRLVSAITTQAATEERLSHQATHDELTDLPSRVLVLETIDELLARDSTRPVAVMFLDVDEFKMVNDSMGHVVGDALLVAAADRIVETVRRDDLVGRISGDEFVVVAPDLDAVGAYALAERVRHAMSDAFVLGDYEMFVSVSVGVTIADDPAASAATLVQEADTAMYRSKDAGKNTITMFDASISNGCSGTRSTSGASRSRSSRSSPCRPDGCTVSRRSPAGRWTE